MFQLLGDLLLVLFFALFVFISTFLEIPVSMLLLFVDDCILPIAPDATRD
jgi:hypothetical protein